MARALVRSVRGSLTLIGSDWVQTVGFSQSECLQSERGQLTGCPLLFFAGFVRVEITVDIKYNLFDIDIMKLFMY